MAGEGVLVSQCEESDEDVNKSIVDLTNAFEAQLDAPGLDTPPVLPIVKVENSAPQDPPPNFINRFGREIRPQEVPHV